MGTLAIDGTKIKADASKHKGMSYERMQKEEKRLRAEIRKLTQRARDVDREEDEILGPDVRGDEIPEELRRRESRLKVIREAKKRLEERKAWEEEQRKEKEKEKQKTENKNTSSGKAGKKRGPKYKYPPRRLSL